MAPKKTCSPSTILTFAGIELDTIRCESRLPEDKLLKCQHLIAAFLRRKKATLKELQSLIGVLNFACSVVLDSINIISGQTHRRFQEYSGRCSVSLSDSTFQETSTGRHGSDGNNSSISPSSTQLASIVQELLSASLKSSSVPTYRRAWKRFKDFQLGVFHSQNASLPIAPATLALFVAYLFANHYAISTVSTHVSALGYYHRLAGLKDPTKTFYITEMLKGYGRINRTLDSRLPITLAILVRIMQVSPTVCASQYQSYMFQAMCSMVFFGFLRIGEIT